MSYAASSSLLATFVTIAQSGSISGAAKRLNVDKSIVSRQLTRLEAELGLRLVNRSTRKLTLTEAGRAVLHEAEEIQQANERIRSIGRHFQQDVVGQLRISCSPVLAERFLVQWVCEFSRSHPSLRIDLSVQDDFSDLIDEKIDIAIRIAEMKDSSLIARKLADNPIILVASPDYLEHSGEPSTPEDLVNHSCIIYQSGGRLYDTWSFSGPNGTVTINVQGNITLDDGASVIGAAAAGAGIAAVFQFTARRDLSRGALVRVLADYQLPEGPGIYAVYPSRNGKPLSATKFLDFVVSRFAQEH